MAMMNKCKHKSMKEMKLDEGMYIICDGCLENEYDSCYTCKKGCDYHLHPSCYSRPPIKTHPFYPKSECGLFVLQRRNHPQPPINNSSCEACGMQVKGWAYVLITSVLFGKDRDIVLHPVCINLPLSFPHEDMTFYLMKQLKRRKGCDCCDNAWVDQPVGWVYASAFGGVGNGVNLGNSICGLCFKRRKLTYPTWKD